jgi:hypothetical protein
MNVIKVSGKDYFDDDNNGYLFGLEEYVEEGFPEYVEWFKTEKDRDKCIKKNKMEVII